MCVKLIISMCLTGRYRFQVLLFKEKLTCSLFVIAAGTSLALGSNSSSKQHGLAGRRMHEENEQAHLILEKGQDNQGFNVTV
jgi:hypothetical protein